MTLSEHIAEDLETRLAAGESFPDPITLSGLANHYEVSLTPVRRAVETLIEKRLLVRGSNGRLEIAPRQRRRRSATPEGTSASVSFERNGRGAKKQPWEGALVREVMRASLMGDERFLREEALAERHGISRTALRQVFHRLAGEGVIEHRPRRGWTVRPFREADMKAFLEVRELLELKALEDARGTLEPAKLEAMRDANVPSDPSHAARLDNQLHRYFIECSGNRYIAAFFDTHGRYYMSMFDYAALGASVVDEMVAQHREILEQLLARRWSRASAALAAHIRAQEPVLKRAIERFSEQDAG